MLYKYTYVSENAEIGNNVEIGPFCVIEEGVKIGEYTKIESNVHIKKGTIIGKNCHIHSGSVLGDLPQDLAFKNEESFLVIGDNVVIRENCVFHKATGAGNATVIGDNCYLMAYVHVAHNVKIGNNVIVANGTQFAGFVEVEERAFVSGLIAVHQFVRIGKYAMVGGSTKLVKDVLPFALCDGNPAKIYGINLVGLRRNGFSPERIKLIKELFHLIYDKTKSFEERIKMLEERGEEEAKILYDFIKRSKRGITDASWRSEE
ncbi:MAG: acyl-ACP--UDP-N-acetylglucosamine O-acyltransferase [Dictyoglomus sp.]